MFSFYSERERERVCVTVLREQRELITCLFPDVFIPPTPRYNFEHTHCKVW